jgi:hypothetical protein
MLDLDITISSDIVDALMDVARYDAVCDSYPLTRHVRRRLEEQGDLRWVQAVAARECLHWTGHDIIQALQHNRPPPRHKESGPVVRAIAELARDVRKLGGFPRAVGLGALDQFHRHFDTDHGYRGAMRNNWFVGGAKEIVEREKIGEYVVALSKWFDCASLRNSLVIGIAILHQELMHLCPHRERSVAAIDALTRCLLMQHRVNRSGIGVLERQFVQDAEAYADAIRGRSPEGRRRWVAYFSQKLLDAMFEAWKEVERVRDHIDREPWLEAPPLSAREQAVYDFVLRKRKATSGEVARALRGQASNLRMVQRDLARLAELGLVQKIGARKDAWYRPTGIVPDPDFEPFEGSPPVTEDQRE